jgi:Fe-S-cluster containining protein
MSDHYMVSDASPWRTMQRFVRYSAKVEQFAGINAGDAKLIQIVDAALVEAAQKSGPWLVCRLGCTQCCMGPFAITQLDARRLRTGLRELESNDPERATRVRERARQAVARISNDFPGNPVTGTLTEDEFPDSMDEDVCPALDPETGGCDLYAARPITCRTFGPPVRCGEESVGVCELCFHGASDAEIAACEVESDPDGVEQGLLEELEQMTGRRGETIVAFALLPDAPATFASSGTS